MFQEFWRRWNTEYLTFLQQHPKLNQPQRNFQVGQIVVIKENNIPPSKWLLSLVIETHLCPDSHVLGLKLRSKHGDVTRPISEVVREPVF